MNQEKLLCGVDLGGTKLSIALVNEDGEIRDKLIVYDHVSKSDQEIAFYIVRLVKQILNKHALQDDDLHGIGVCFPGHLRYKEGMTITTSNLAGFKNLPLRFLVQSHFQTKVILDNDANAQTYAEFRYGAGKEYDTMIFMTVSSGIGGGIVLNNHLYRGMTGTAGEFGHMIIDPHSQIRCGCGNYGCLMGCASGLSLPQVAQKFLEQGIETGLKLSAEEPMNGKMLRAGLDRYDPLCLKILDEYAGYIGTGVYNLFQIFNPPLIVLGGGFMNLGDILLSKIRVRFQELVKDMLFDELEIAPSILGDDAGLIGAAALVLEQHN